MSGPLDYRDAGVDIDAADEAKYRIKVLAEATFTAGARGGFGGFGGQFRVPAGMRAPVLVSSADGVGTKIKVAIEANRHDTIGLDLVNHCVNDILVQGALPLFFLDYVAFGKLIPDVVSDVVLGVAAGCLENKCALVGGETAEMPGVYTPPDYDLAGFIVGCVEEDSVLGPDRVRAGDQLVALASSGLHTNGYSLARKIVFDRMRLTMSDRFPGEGASVADVLLRVHRSYREALEPVLHHVHAMAHITGGGLWGNVGRALPPTLSAVIYTDTWTVPNVFTVLAEGGQVPRAEMFRAFNMGVGMVVVVAPGTQADVITAARGCSISAWVCGDIRPGAGQVILT